MSDSKSNILNLAKNSFELLSLPQKRVVDRFLHWLAQSDATEIDRHLLLTYGKNIGTRAVLADLEKAFLKCSSNDQDFRAELRAAVLDHRRRMDGNTSVVDIVSSPWWLPFAANCDLDQVSILEIKRLDAWLRWMADRGRTSPTADDFLEYGARFDSAAPLVSLQTTLAKLNLPNIPALALELPKAIAQKRSQSRGMRRPQPRAYWSREYSVAPEDLPSDWRKTLEAFRSNDAMSDTDAPSKKTVGSHERRLRELAWSCCTTGNPVELTAEALARHARMMRQRGCRATSLDINISFLVRFSAYHGIDRRELEKMKAIARELKRAQQVDVPLKFERLAIVGSTKKTLGKAVDLLRKAQTQKSLKHRVSYLNGACALALFSLVPLRVADSNLQFGKHVVFNGSNYWLHIETGKSGNIFSGPLANFVTPFLDALLLRGCDESYLDEFRREAEARQLHIFSHSDARHLSDECVANLWSRHVKSRPHIARTLVHTELGKLGAAGVAQALALCAQRDPKTAIFYQDQAMNDALLLESNEILLEGFSEREIEELFVLASS